MFPTLSHLIEYIIGVFIPLPFKTFGLFIALAFLTGSYFISKDLTEKNEADFTYCCPHGSYEHPQTPWR